MSGALKFKGQVMVLGGVAYTVPALSLGAMEAFEERIAALPSMTRVEQLRVTGDLMLRAMQRNYPNITREEVAELVDAENAGEIFTALMGISVPKPSAEDPPGELGVMASGTGSPSTPTWQPV